MDFFRRLGGDSEKSAAPAGAKPGAAGSKGGEDDTTKSLNARRDQELRALGEIYYQSARKGRLDTRALSRKLRDIQKIDERLESLRQPKAPPVPPPTARTPPPVATCRCGSSYIPGARFCSACGSELPRPNVELRACPACNMMVEATAAFCTQCGSSMTARPVRVRHPLTGQEASFEYHPTGSMRADAPPLPSSDPVYDYDAVDELYDGATDPSDKQAWVRNLERFARPAQVDAEAYINRGREYLHAGRCREAAAEFEAALLQHPRDGRIHYLLGVARYKNGEIEAAIEAFERTTRIDRNNSDAHNDLGLCYAKQNNVREALDHYQQALRANPSHSDAHYNLAHLYIQQMAYPEAIRHLQMYLQTSPHAGDYRTVSDMIEQLTGAAATGQAMGPETFLPQR
jgi:lipoprotein NlpI